MVHLSFSFLPAGFKVRQLVHAAARQPEMLTAKVSHTQPQTIRTELQAKAAKLDSSWCQRMVEPRGFEPLTS